jgi:hypothetical protein
MLRRLLLHIRHNVIAYTALFVALGGTGAYAANEWTGANIVDGSLTGADIFDNTVSGKDITNGSLTGTDVFDNTIASADVTNKSLTGADINESTLGTVTSSVLGGLGRDGVAPGGGGKGSCDPNSTSFQNCNISASLTLPAPAHVLVIGTVRGASATTAGALGQCQLGTTSGPIPSSTVTVDAPGVASQNTAIAGVTGVLPAGTHSFGIDCNEVDNDIVYHEARVTAVALSDR